MGYQGRSPLNDVTRSVVLGAAMIAPALLEQCTRGTPDDTPNTNGSGGSTNVAFTAGNDADAGAGGGTTSQTTSTTTTSGTTDPQAPPPGVVRPRQPENPPNAMPTRGFAGGAHVRG